jgi:hypothetical protein
VAPNSGLARLPEASMDHPDAPKALADRSADARVAYLSSAARDRLLAFPPSGIPMQSGSSRMLYYAQAIHIPYLALAFAVCSIR